MTHALLFHELPGQKKIPSSPANSSLHGFTPVNKKGMLPESPSFT